MSLSTQRAIIYGLIPFGPLYLRLNDFNGSDDYLWTTLPIFQLPIFGLIPTMLMKSGKIKRGRLKGSPFDFFIIVTLLFRAMASFISDQMDAPWSIIFKFTLNLIGVMLPFIIRIYAPLCSLCRSNLKSGIDVILKIFSSGAMSMMIIEILMLVVGFIPFIGSIPGLLEMVPFIGSILVYALYFIPLYIYNNIRRENNIKSFCRDKVKFVKVLAGVIVPIAMTIFLQNFDPASFAG
jgi:hypothetical protein